jgi:hypothetical protein
MKSLRWIVFSTLCAAALALGCGDDDDGDGDAGADADADSDADADADADAGALEIVGEYADDWGGTHVVTADAWTSEFPGAGDAGTTTSVAHITAYDNGADFLVAQNDAEAAYDPNLWARYDWTYSGDELYYCQIEFAAADEETAASNAGADHADLAAGCGGFGWTHLTGQ